MAGHTTLTSLQVYELFDPWPIALPSCEWVLRTAKVEDLAEYKCYWWLNVGLRKHRVTMREALKRVIEKDWMHQRHMVLGLARSGHLPRAILIYDGVVVDGNHGLLALAFRRYNGSILVAEAIVPPRRARRSS